MSAAGSAAVLIVEDEVTLRLSVARMLRKQGFSVLEAPDGDRAVELIRDRSNEVALVLLDITLPGTSGPEVLAELRRIRPAAKVILTSAYGRETIAGSLKAFEPQGFLRKPYQLRHLVAVVREALPAGKDQPASGSGAE
jgi:DNA-binding response OmpR family regulator